MTIGVYKRTAEMREHISKSKKGSIPWNKGKTTIPEYVCDCCKKTYRPKSTPRGKRTFCSAICKDNSEVGRKRSDEFCELKKIQTKEQLKKDKYREQEIQEKLNCSFFRVPVYSNLIRGD